MSNENCLEGMRCPKCGSFEPFWILCSCLVKVYDNGTDETAEHDWDGASHCECGNPGCQFSGEVKDFIVEA